MLTNTGRSKVIVAGLQTDGTGFSVSGATFPLTLPAGKAAEIRRHFQTTSGGPGRRQFPRLRSEPGHSVYRHGIGVSKPELAITPATLNFGDVAVGTTEKRTVELSASGGNVTISSVSSSSSQFAVLDTPLPLTLRAGKNISLNVAFAPQASGNRSGTLSFASDAAIPQRAQL